MSLFGKRNFCIITTVWVYQILWPTFLQVDRCANHSYFQATSIWTLPNSPVSHPMVWIFCILDFFKGFLLEMVIWTLETCQFHKNKSVYYRSHWPRLLRRRSRPPACWDCGFELHREHAGLSVVSVVCCQVKVSATGWSLVQRSPTDCAASLCVV